MKSSAKSVKLATVDDLFSTEESRQDEGREKVAEIPLEELHPFPDHPFSVRDDDAMRETAESVKEYGVLVPAIVRPREDDGGHELVAGHRRKRACELADLETMPCIIMEGRDGLKRCAACGAYFAPTGSRSLYCPPCSAQRARRRKAEWARKKRGGA